MASFKEFRADQRGGVAITTAILAPLLVGSAGIAVVYSASLNSRTSLQSALDSAVLAGAALIETAASNTAIETAQKTFDNNLSRFAVSSLKGMQTAFSIDGTVLSGKAAGQAQNPFGGLVGNSSFQVDAKSAATKATVPVCVLGLNGLDNGAFDMNGAASFQAPECAVQANSNSRSGMTQEGKPAAKAKKFGVTGGHKGDNFSPPPVDGSPKIADPYAKIPFPTPGACGSGNKGTDIKDSAELSPGTFCGGIHVFGNGTKVKLKPG